MSRTSRSVVPPLVLLLVTLAPAAAADGPGPFVGIEATWSAPTAPSPSFVVRDPNDDGNVQGAVEAVDAERSFCPRITAGWRFDRGSVVEVTWWEYDETGSRRFSSGSGLLWDVLSPPDIGLNGFVGTARASWRVRSTVTDIAWRKRVLDGEGSFAVSFRVGLRHLVHETRLATLYEDGLRSVRVRLGGRARGTGLLAGVTGTIHAGGRWHLDGSVRYALLAGTRDSSYRAASTAGLPRTDITREHDDQFTMLDGSLGVRVELGGGVQAWLALELARWSGVSEVPDLVDDVQDAAHVSSPEDASWSALVCGIGYRW